jgi:hypothetical protein
VSDAATGAASGRPAGAEEPPLTPRARGGLTLSSEGVVTGNTFDKYGSATGSCAG